MNPLGSTLDEEPFVVDSPSRDEDVEPEGSEASSSDDDEEEEEEEEGEEEEVSVNKKFQQIRHDLKHNKLDLCDPAKLKQFADHNASYLGQKTTGDSDHSTLLHLLVEDANEEDKAKAKDKDKAMDKTKDKDKVIDKYQPLVKLLVELHPELLGEIDSNERTPLYLAIEKKRSKLVRSMCDTHPNIDAVLNIPCIHSENCLHVAIRKNISPKLAIFLIKHASEATLRAKDYRGITPLHLAVAYERCTDGQLEIVKALIERSDKAMDERTNAPDSFSPYRYHEYTRAKAIAAEAETKKAAKEKEKEAAQGKKDGSSTAGGDGPGGRDAAGAKSKAAAYAKDMRVLKPFTGPRGQGATLLGKDLGRTEPLRRLTTSSEAPLGEYGIVGGSYGGSGGAGNAGYKSIALGLGSGEPPKIGDGSSDGKGLNPKTPVAAEEKRRKKAEKKTEKKEVKVTEESAGMIRDYLKLHCMRTRNEEDAVDFLHGRNQGMSSFLSPLPNLHRC
jgi:ankyrin repeat protein